MRKSVIITLCLAALSLWGCGKTAEVNAPLKKGLTFTASIGGYATKATDTAFENGDLIGLYGTTADHAYSNYPLESRDGALVMLDPKEDRTDTRVSFQAYYPYKSVNDKTFYVNADQSTWAQYTASDLMMAEFNGFPGRTGEIHLVFNHMLSKFVVIPSRDADLIANVYIANVKGQMQWDFMYTDVQGIGGSVKALKSDYNGEPAWKAILPPQWAEPRIFVERTDGSSYEYRLSSGLYLQIGCQTLARLDIQENEPTANVSTLIEAWTPDNEAAFGPAQYGTYVPVIDNCGAFTLEAANGTVFNAECELAWNNGKLVFSNGKNLFWCPLELNADPSSIPTFNRVSNPLKPDLLASDDAGNVVIGNYTDNILQVIYTDDIINGSWSTLIDEADLTAYGTVGRVSVTGDIREKAVLTLTCATLGEYTQYVIYWEIENGQTVGTNLIPVEGKEPLWVATNNGAVALGDRAADGFLFHAYAEGLRALQFLPGGSEVFNYESYGMDANSNFSALDVAWYNGHRFVATAAGEHFDWSSRIAFLFNADQPGGWIRSWLQQDTDSWLTNENFISDAVGGATYSTSNALLVPTEDCLFYFILANAHKKVVWFSLK